MVPPELDVSYRVVTVLNSYSCPQKGMKKLDVRNKRSHELTGIFISYFPIFKSILCRLFKIRRQFVYCDYYGRLSHIVRTNRKRSQP